MLKIWHMPKSRSFRVLWLCEELGVPYETRPVAFGVQDAELLAVNPYGSAPVLEDGEVRMIESVAMLMYIAGKYGGEALTVGPEEPGYADYLQWLVAGEAAIAMPGNMLIYDRFVAPEGEKGGTIARVCTKKLKTGFAMMEQVLASRPYLAGERLTLADISASFSVAVAQKLLGLGELVPAGVADYAARLKARPAYQRAMAVK